MDFTIHLSSQLREHLRALRKTRGMTQTALGQLLGVGQARIAEIESNPGSVSVDQLMKILSALRASLLLRDDLIDVASNRPDATVSPASPAASNPRKSARQPSVNIPPAGQPRVPPLTGGGRRQAAPVVASGRKANIPLDAQTLRDANPNSDVTATSGRDFVIRAKKGSW